MSQKFCCTHTHSWEKAGIPLNHRTTGARSMQEQPRMARPKTQSNPHTSQRAYLGSMLTGSPRSSTCPIPAERHDCRIQNRLQLVKRAQIGLQQLAISIRTCTQRLYSKNWTRKWPPADYWDHFSLMNSAHRFMSAGSA